MANASAGDTAKAKKPATPTWHELAAVTDAKRRLWLLSRSRTGWAVCGREWEAVAVEPMAAGLDVLTAMRAGTRRGCQVLADHLSDRLYVAVPADSSNTFENIPGPSALRRTPTAHPEHAAGRHDRGRLGQPPARRQDAGARRGRPVRRPPAGAHLPRPCENLRVMSDRHTVLDDPEGRTDAELPLDRVTHERVARVVLAWSDPAALRPDDYEQVGLLLAGPPTRSPPMCAGTQANCPTTTDGVFSLRSSE
ncbi:hypothetical protein [Streptomyces canus]|uniref:hypothetical protein n=1 Tax=Streptomyces canus TaxID=58343 RepID=UPI0027D82A06|nr:hypothetical protein [Streptomyces canus]